MIVLTADRLSRNSTEYPMVIAKVHKSGVEVWRVADAPSANRLVVDNQMDKFLRFLEGWQAETESVTTQIHVSTRMRQIAQEGRWCGGRGPSVTSWRQSRILPAIQLFEPARGCGRWRPTPDTSMWYARCFAGIPTHTGTLWSGQAVREVLRNPIYMGVISYRRKSRLSATPILVQGEHPALIENRWYGRGIGVSTGPTNVPSPRVNTVEIG